MIKKFSSRETTIHISACYLIFIDIMILKTESITYCQIFTITGNKIFIKQDRTKMKKKSQEAKYL